MNINIQKLKLFFVMIMLNIGKVFSSILVLVTISFVFLCNVVSYACVVSKDCLRAPIGNYDRLNRVLNEELSLEGKSILIVQDDPDKAEFTDLSFCVDHGAKEEDIVIAPNYEAAINALNTKKFDLIILDMGFYISSGKTKDDDNWAGISVLEYIVSNNMIAFVLVDSTKAEYNLSEIHRKIKENPAKYPNLVRLGETKIEKFTTVFLKSNRDLKENADRLKSFLRGSDLDGLRTSL